MQNRFIPPEQHIAQPSEYVHPVDNTTNASQEVVQEQSYQAIPEPQAASQEPVTAKEEVQVSDFGTLPPLEFDQLPHNVTITRPVVSNKTPPVFETITMPSATASATASLLNRMPQFGTAASAADINWAQTYLNGNFSSPAGRALEASLTREGSDWHQGVEINGEVIKSMIPKFPVPKNAVLEGQQAIQMAMSTMGIGDVFHTGLYHSGFWVSFKPAPDSVWLTINRLLGTQVMGISRETYGLLHSNATSLTVSALINALLPYIYSTSINPTELDITNLPNHLSNLDEHDFIWGFIAANYTNGFGIERSCIVDPSKCRHVIAETIHVPEMQIVDRQALPEFARNHMRTARTPGSLSLKAVTDYQTRLAASCDQVVALTAANGFTTNVVFSVPSSAKKARMSDEYVNDIQENLLKSITKDTTPAEREEHYEELSKATEMRFYQHWVKEIRIGDNSISGEKEVAGVLSVWTRDPKLRQQFFDGIASFIDKVSFSVIGLTAAVCPKCGANHSRPEQALRGRVDYIPVDIVQLFSNLAEFRTRLIAAR